MTTTLTVARRSSQFNEVTWLYWHGHGIEFSANLRIRDWYPYSLGEWLRSGAISENVCSSEQYAHTLDFCMSDYPVSPDRLRRLGRGWREAMGELSLYVLHAIESEWRAPTPTSL